MAGRMGNERVTVQSLTVHAVDAERGLLLIKGAVPGSTRQPRPGPQRGQGAGGRPERERGGRGLMKTVSIVSASGETAGTVELPDEVFDVQANVPLIHQVVVAQQAAARQGTHCRHATAARCAAAARSRTGRRAPAGPGRARSARRSSSGGGTAHGPRPRSYVQRTPKKMKAAALRGALSERARHDRVHVVSGFVESDLPRTKDAVAVLSALTGTRRGVGALVVAHRDDELTWMSLRNVPGVHVLRGRPAQHLRRAGQRPRGVHRASAVGLPRPHRRRTSAGTGHRRSASAHGRRGGAGSERGPDRRTRGTSC